jgi:hypothetical protein
MTSPPGGSAVRERNVAPGRLGARTRDYLADRRSLRTVAVTGRFEVAKQTGRTAGDLLKRAPEHSLRRAIVALRHRTYYRADGGSGALGFGQPESLSVVRARSYVAGPIRGRPSGRPLIIIRHTAPRPVDHNLCGQMSTGHRPDVRSACGQMTTVTALTGHTAVVDQVPDLVPRKARQLIAEALADTRVVTSNGARQAGKSTLARLTAQSRNPATSAAA